MTWGRNKLWGAPEVYLFEFEWGTGAREIYSSVDQTNKVKTKKKRKKKVFTSKISTNSVYRLKILAIFHEFSSEDLKKRSSFQKFYEIRCEFSKITKILAVNTNSGVLGLDLHSSSPKPVNFFGAQSSLGGRGHNFRLGGTSSHLRRHGPEMPPLGGPGPACFA